MKIIAIILLSSLIGCSSFNRVEESKYQPSASKGCVAETSTNARLKCLSNWLRASQSRENGKIVFEEIEGDRVDWKNIYVKYSYCNTDVKTEQVYSCIEHETTKYKPTYLYYIWDYGKLVLIAGGFYFIGGL
jgi:hypothetical protein